MNAQASCDVTAIEKKENIYLGACENKLSSVLLCPCENVELLGSKTNELSNVSELASQLRLRRST